MDFNLSAQQLEWQENAKAFAEMAKEMHESMREAQ